MPQEWVGVKRDIEVALAQMTSLVKTTHANVRLRLAEFAERRKDYVKAEELIQGVLGEFKENVELLFPLHHEPTNALKARGITLKGQFLDIGPWRPKRSHRRKN